MIVRSLEEALAPISDGCVLAVAREQSGGAMEAHFGLKRNDTIVEIGQQPVKELTSVSDVKDALLYAYSRNQQLVVVRDEKRMTLPIEVPAAPAAASASPDKKAAPPPADKSPLQKQIDALPGVAR